MQLVLTGSQEFATVYLQIERCPVKKIPRKLNVFISIIVLMGSAILYCFWQNNSLVITKSNHVSAKIPGDFNDFTIAHISDLHNKKFGENQMVILDKIKSISPDIIVITGDLIDRRRYDLDTAMTFIKGAIHIAPIYYVPGNHEAWSGSFPIIKESLIDAGVHVLEDTELELSKGSSSIRILGLSDPAFLTSDYTDGTDVTSITENLARWSDDENFKILLSHRPELFDLYCKNNMDLIFTGHAHGGQFRIPFIGALFAPNQGWFPKYTAGSYSKDSSVMFVSRGLGNSLIPIRIFNRPEIVAVTLKSE